VLLYHFQKQIFVPACLPLIFLTSTSSDEISPKSMPLAGQVINPVRLGKTHFHINNKASSAINR